MIITLSYPTLPIAKHTQCALIVQSFAIRNILMRSSKFRMIWCLLTTNSHSTTTSNNPSWWSKSHWSRLYLATTRCYQRGIQIIVQGASEGAASKLGEWTPPLRSVPWMQNKNPLTRLISPVQGTTPPLPLITPSLLTFVSASIQSGAISVCDKLSSNSARGTTETSTVIEAGSTTPMGSACRRRMAGQ